MTSTDARLDTMPTAVLVAVIASGVAGLLLLVYGLLALIFTATMLLAVGGFVGMAEMVVTGRLLQRQQSARVSAMSLALLQAIFGVLLIVDRNPIGFVWIVLAGLVVIPLSMESADQYFAAPE
jgi:hypothetical protein